MWFYKITYTIPNTWFESHALNISNSLLIYDWIQFTPSLSIHLYFVHITIWARKFGVLLSFDALVVSYVVKCYVQFCVLNIKIQIYTRTTGELWRMKMRYRQFETKRKMRIEFSKLKTLTLLLKTKGDPS